MTLKHRPRGGGITEQPQLVMKTYNIRETLEHARANSTFEGWVAEIEAITRAVLVRAGADPDKQSTYIDRFDEDTREDYAGRILQRIVYVRHAIRKNDPADAAYHALHVGWLVREADFKFEWESDALRGRKTWERLTERRQQANAERAESADADRMKWQAEADEIWSRHPDWTATNVAKEIEKSLDGKWNTIRRKIKRKQ